MLNKFKKVAALCRTAGFLFQTYDRDRLLQLYHLLKQHDLEALLQKIQIADGLFVKNFPPGHFYSPLPDIEEIRSARGSIFGKKDAIPDIELNDSKQISFFKEFSKYYPEIPFPSDKKEGLRYYFNNSFFSYGDGVILYSFLRHFKPKKVIEVGSGFSSALMLDTSERFLESKVDFTFIEPYPDRLEQIAGKPGENFNLIEDSVQNVDLAVFKKLEEGDILFIDSSHVGKIGSDVLHILFNILPILKSGVLIHFHDIFWPFEYPESWVENGRAWNESYLLRAFLACNKNYEMVFFNSYFVEKNRNLVAEIAPLMLEMTEFDFNFPNASLWLRKR
jgi:hypothetical protein